MATEARATTNRTFIVVGVILGIIAAALAFAFTRSSGGGTQTSNAPATGVTVLVAAQDITSRTLLTPEMVTKAQVSVAPADALTDPSQLNGSQYLTVSITKNSVITKSVLASTTAQVASAPPPPPLTIPAGMVAMAIPVSGTVATASGDLQSVGFYIHPGDHFDILVDNGSGTAVRYAFQDVPVLEVGTYAATGGGGTPSVYVIALPRNEAEAMTLLLEGVNNMRIVKYVLRPVAEYGKNLASPNYEPAGTTKPPAVPDSGATPQTLSSLFGG